MGARRTGPAPSRAPKHDEITLLLVDDHPMWRDTLRKVLEHAGVGRIVGEAGSAEDAIRIAREKRPHVVIMDINLPGMSGVEATRILLEELPSAKVVALSSSDEPAHILDIVRSGASGYLVKTAHPDEVASAVRRVHAGEAVLPAETSEVVLAEFRRLATGGAPAERDAKSPLARLTDREMQVLALMAEGRSNQAIGERLFLGSKSVEAHVRSIYTKLDLEPQPDDHRRVLATLRYMEGRQG